MLDNLKLGYGGTKTEMERLIADAAALTDVQKELNITVAAGDTSFANIVNAISVVQSNMGIMGTTAKESATTISGSFNSMKAAWNDLLAGLSNENADFDELINKFIDSAVSFTGNILPKISVALDSVTKLIEILAPKVIDFFPEIFSKLAPNVVRVIGIIFESIATTLSDNANILTKTVVDIILTFIEVFTTPGVLSALLSASNALMSSLAANLIIALPKLLIMVPEIMENLCAAIIDWVAGEGQGSIYNVGKTFIEDIGKSMVDSVKDPTFWEGLLKTMSPALLVTDFVTKVIKKENDSEQTTPTSAISITQNIYSQKQTAADLMQEAQWNAERAVYMGV